MDRKYYILQVVLFGCCTLRTMEGNEQAAPLESPSITFSVSRMFGIDINQSSENGRAWLVKALIEDIRANERIQDGLLTDILKMPQTAAALTALERSWVESGKQDAAQDLAMANSQINVLQSQLERLRATSAQDQ